MLRNVLCWIVVAVVCTGCVNINTEKCGVAGKAESQKVCPKDAKMLRHVVLFRFKEGTSPEKIKEVENAFASLPGKIDVIKRFEWGTNVSVENRSDGFTHCFVSSFLSEADRDAYLIHPDHKEFAKTLGGNIDKVLVIDYWAK
ncbi:MAG: Dabb family protein [Sedimentisphaerales bacterium]|jgi:hypothetical protein